MSADRRPAADENEPEFVETVRYHEQRIRERAYQLWEGEGRQEGRSEEYYRRATDLIGDRTESAPPPEAKHDRP
jgi:hypothetical protein